MPTFILATSLVILVAVAACSGPTPAPQETTLATIPSFAATLAPSPAPTEVPTETPTERPTATPVYFPTPDPAYTSEPLSTSTPTPAPTPTPGPTPDLTHLHNHVSPPVAPAHMEWRWDPDQDSLREVVTQFTIHTDVVDWSGQYGFHLILIQNSISGTGFHFGLEAEANGRGFFFARWNPRPPSKEANARPGIDILEMKRSYDWTAGDYLVRVAPDGLEDDGEWFSFWVTDQMRDETTWIGAVRFPLMDGQALMEPHAQATIEIYGKELVRPIDIPKWHVSVGRPLGDGVPATWGYTSYPFDGFENELLNSNVRYDPQEGRAHLVMGGDTERRTPAEQLTFE